MTKAIACQKSGVIAKHWLILKNRKLALLESRLPHTVVYTVSNISQFRQLRLWQDCLIPRQTLCTKHTISHKPHLFLFHLQSTTSASDDKLIDSFVIFIPPLWKSGGGGGILVYICPWFRPWFRPSFRPSFRNSVTLFRQRYLHNRLR